MNELSRRSVKRYSLDTVNAIDTFGIGILQFSRRHDGFNVIPRRGGGGGGKGV